MSDPRMTSLEKASVISTVALFVLSIVVAWYSAEHGSALGIAVSVGALGGLAHEVAQSGGKILWFQRNADGFYLGGVAGMILGAVSGVLIVRGLVVDSSEPFNATEVVYEVFAAGLALKGVVEAAAGNTVPDGARSGREREPSAKEEVASGGAAGS